MQLTVRPAALDEAAAQLIRCGDRLDAARSEFRAAAERDLPAVGPGAIAAAGNSARAADAGVAVIATDLRTLARALRLLARGYAELDRELIRRAHAPAHR